MNYNFLVNDKALSIDNNVISGREILEMTGFLPIEKFDLFKKIKGHEYEPIQYDETVDLAEPGIEKFLVSIRESITFSVDDEEYSTLEMELTPLEIFQIIGLNHEKFYLKQIKKHIEITYKNDESQSIDMIGNPRFITLKRAPATVSSISTI